MNETRASAPPWAWWLATALLAAAVVVDAVDGAPLKLATSVLLALACLLMALTRSPRPPAVRGAVLALAGAAAALLLYRIGFAGL